MSVALVFETHATTEDNEAGIMTGWLRRDGERVLVIGHMSTYYAIVARCTARSAEDVAAEPFDWQPGWELGLS